VTFFAALSCCTTVVIKLTDVAESHLVVTTVHCVSIKRDPDIIDCNFKKD